MVIGNAKQKFGILFESKRHQTLFSCLLNINKIKICHPANLNIETVVNWRISIC